MYPEVPDSRLGILKEKAAAVRNEYIKRPRGKNVCVAEVVLEDQRVLAAQATSGAKPLDCPRSKAEGGFFQPTIDAISQREMNTDAEYKELSALAAQLQGEPREIRGALHLFTELSPCDSCSGILKQFGDMFPGIEIHLSFAVAYGVARSIS